MKPICLEIEGFNSFREKQIINFKKLTDKGFFGIFGKTGSGKSSILDAIIYALYGKIDRDLGGFINLNQDKAVIKYTFEIGAGDQRKIYHIHRVTKRDKDGGYKSTIAKLYEVKGENLEILSDGKSNVDKKILEIIGLKHTDFTRAVVLPQGRFSEFLKTTPKERSEMLERLFALRSYGSALTDKLKKESQKNNTELIRIDGELNYYKDVNEDKLKEISNEYNILVNKVAELRKEKIAADNIFDKYKNIWTLQNDLNSKIIEKNKYDESKIFIDEKKKLMKEGERALLVKPYIDRLQSADKDLNNVIESLTKENNDYTYIKSLIVNIKNDYEKAFLLKEKELPELNKKEANVSQAIKLVQQLKQYDTEINVLRERYSLGDSERKSIESSIKSQEEKLNQYKNTISIKENEIEKIFLSPAEREKTIKALDVEKSIKNFNFEIKKLVNDNEKQNEEINNDRKVLKELEQNFNQIENEIDNTKIEITDLNNNFPGDNNLLIEKLNQCNDLEKNLEENKKLLTLKLEKDKEYTLLKTLYEDLKVKRENKNSEILSLSEKLILEKKELEHINVNNLAGIIASKLKDDEPCPVCGNVHKVKLAELVNGKVIEEKNVIISTLEQQYENTDKEIRALDTEFSQTEVTFNSVRSNLKDLDEKLKNVNISEEELIFGKIKNEYIQLKISLDKWNISKDELINKLSELEKKKSLIEIQKVKFEEAIKKGIALTEKYTSDIENKNIDLSQFNKKIAIIKNELGIDDVEHRYADIIENDKKRDILERELKEARNSQEHIEKKIKTENQRLQVKANELSIILESGKQKGQFIEKLKNDIKILSEDRNPELYIEEIKSKIILIIGTEKKLKDHLESHTNKKNDIEKNINTLIRFRDNLLNDMEKLKGELSLKLQENSFNSKEDVLVSYLSKGDIDALKLEIKKYDDEYVKILNNIEEIKKKLNGEKVEKVQWDEIQINTDRVNKLLEENIGLIAAKKSEISKMKVLVEKLKLILIEKEKYNHKKSLLDELEKIFKGNKFVEFVAHGQLKYVTAEASRRLLNNTKEKFELKLNEHGEFYIKDNSSGGLLRSTNSLSGGELFLTSLSLALALSSHIQLKGSAPLEFFFLDEGFGTLDDELLDTVMDSLEKLRSEKLSVGIISHVKELRDRVPIKILVKSSSAVEGSKIVIENS
ncbi:MAG: sbcC [Clostridiaceae bacterium]|jgi:exonuclease SbcC|nr:sbcC [Clostridiaceae bacterium]